LKTSHLTPGLYEKLVDEELSALFSAHPELEAISTIEHLDQASEAEALGRFFGTLLRETLPNATQGTRVDLLNRLIELLGTEDGLAYVRTKRLVDDPLRQLREVRQYEHQPASTLPATPLSIGCLLTGAADDPPLEREIRTEMRSCDRIDILVSFIKWSGLALLLSAFEEIEAQMIPVRIITTSYMGASDPEAIEWLAKRRNVEIRISYDTERTRLHAKAYHFVRASGYSTAYIGSANMSRPAMTSGLEWTVKVTAQDMPHILSRFDAEFETYWRNDNFIPFSADRPERFRAAIAHGRQPADASEARFFAELKPHPFQERVLESIEAARLEGSRRNLIVAATGTGKTVIAAFDFGRYHQANSGTTRLLFVAHRKEILQQARDCFRMVLRDFNFGELLVDGQQPQNWDAVFASIQSLNQKAPWEQLGEAHFDYVIIDEAHHGRAPIYRPLFEHLTPSILLGLSATPERMDGSSILPDFDDRFAAEIRLPEALEEKLLCPFHYFGVTDPVSTNEERFWRNGRYDTEALESIYSSDSPVAKQRLDVILNAIQRYHPNLTSTRGIGFCVSVRHAEFMARHFRDYGYPSETLLGNTPQLDRSSRLASFRRGATNFLFVVDVLSEGIDIPEINLVMFLRPTDSLTVFLQQLGRGLRHAPGKDCLTVLDFVGQVHRRYRMERKFAALLPHTRGRIDREIASDFPSLPPGCSIQLERVAREHVLENIRHSLGDLRRFVPEAIQSFTSETGKPLTFGNFVDETGLSPVTLLATRTWSEWKSLAAGTSAVVDSDLPSTRQALRRITLRTDNRLLEKALRMSADMAAEQPAAYDLSDEEAAMLHYLLWGRSGAHVGIESYQSSFQKWLKNRSSAEDLREIITWRRKKQSWPCRPLNLPFQCPLRLHAAYGLREITAAFGLANLTTSGPAGSGAIHLEDRRIYLHLVTFRKEERDFSPTTRYQDYPVSPTVLHWESQSNKSRESPTGQNYLNFLERGYTILFFARVDKRLEGETAPYVFLGPAKALISADGDRPIRMLWELAQPMPAELFELARPA